VASNCLSVEPLETPLGTKRKINQSSCNKDFSCVNGFCPSFVTAEGAQLRRPQAKAVPAAEIPEPTLPALDGVCGIVVPGVGGTGVVTIGSLLGMAAHLAGKGVKVLDITGLAQKGGAVLSHIQIAAKTSLIHATRVPTGDAAVLIGCDAIVAASLDALSRVRRGRTRAVVNSAAVPSAAASPKRQNRSSLSTRLANDGFGAPSNMDQCPSPSSLHSSLLRVVSTSQNSTNLVSSSSPTDEWALFNALSKSDMSTGGTASLLPRAAFGMILPLYVVRTTTVLALKPRWAYWALRTIPSGTMIGFFGLNRIRS
jgi:hypothetical protein